MNRSHLFARSASCLVMMLAAALPSVGSIHQPTLALPLAHDLNASPVGGHGVAQGPYRHIQLNGKWGWQPLSLKSSLQIPSDQHTRDRGSITVWVSPLETLATSFFLTRIAEKDPHWNVYSLLSDTLPLNAIEGSTFAWFWQSLWHPQMIAKFKTGRAGGAASDYSVIPYVPVEHLSLHKHEWYQLTLTWDKPASRLKVYVNGILAATTLYPFKAETPRPELYLGNTAMAFADLAIFDTELPADEIAAGYARSTAPKNAAIQRELEGLFTVTPKPSVDWTAGTDWHLRYERSLTQPGDFDGWRQQGCLVAPYELREKQITPEGLLIQTPDQIHTETRVYFWSPDSFEGDVAVEFEFRPEQNTGLALLVVQATGLQREDFLTDHPPRTTGSMSTIIGDRIKNYHWEFFRRAVDVRGDLGTQVLVKNPWNRPLGLANLPPLQVGSWHKLLFVQEGGRLRAAIDGQWALDVQDEAFNMSGPVLNSGRIGLRLMYASRMRFKNLKIWNRHAPVAEMPASR
jgi:hypothetical protein